LPKTMAMLIARLKKLPTHRRTKLPIKRLSA
jgi:hypothetical protein